MGRGIVTCLAILESEFKDTPFTASQLADLLNGNRPQAFALRVALDEQYLKEAMFRPAPASEVG